MKVPSLFGYDLVGEPSVYHPLAHGFELLSSAPRGSLTAASQHTLKVARRGVGRHLAGLMMGL